MRTAHVVLHIDPNTRRVVSGGIYGEASINLTYVGDKITYAEILHGAGSTFSEAKRNCIQQLKSSKIFRWILDVPGILP